MKLIYISVAPVLIIAYYIYFRDKYEKEPLKILLSALIAGAFIVFPVVFAERYVGSLNSFTNQIARAGFNAFIVAGFIEESFKYLVLILIFWSNKNFNEKFDGIVYAVFVSLGFALIENFLYVFKNGYDVGVIRAFTAVPAHSLFAVSMGFFLGRAKFYPKKRFADLFLALLIPIIFHGIYDFILMSGLPNYTFIFYPYLIILLIIAFRQMKLLSEASIYRNDGFGSNSGNSLGF